MKARKSLLRMSYFTAFIAIIIATAGLSSCTVSARTGNQHMQTKDKPLPPGQVNKITGNRSAAPYAPGHNK